MVALFLFPYHHPSVDSVDSSPLWETYLPLLEERWHAVAVIRRPFFTFQHVKASRYGLPYLLICCTCVSCIIRCFLSVTAAETRI